MTIDISIPLDVTTPHFWLKSIIEKINVSKLSHHLTEKYVANDTSDTRTTICSSSLRDNSPDISARFGGE
jgi:hypothetical protein